MGLLYLFTFKNTNIILEDGCIASVSRILALFNKVSRSKWPCDLKPSPHLRAISADSPRARSEDSVRGMSTYRSHTMFCVHIYCACPVNQTMSWSEAAAGMCVGYILVTRRKKRPKYTKRFWTRWLFND
jgi:hypothetical protein